MRRIMDIYPNPTKANAMWYSQRIAETVTGKWLIFFSSDEVNDAWQKVAELTAKGVLGVYAKVSTQRSIKPEMGEHKAYVIQVYTRNYQEDSDIDRVATILKKHFPDKKMYYKGGNVYGRHFENEPDPLSKRIIK